MSNSCSDCFSDLLCTEEPELLADEDLSDETVPDLMISAVDFDESIAGLLEDERKYLPKIEYIQRYDTEPLEVSAREKSVQWILKVQRYFGFQPMTAYLAVSYLDRFLSTRGLQADTSGGWPMQLLSVACLSLATKLEETAVPLLSQLQLVEDASLMFESVSIERMEVLILRTLDWRLRSVTPFHYIEIFAHKLDSAGYCTDFLIARATDLISSNLKDASFLEYWPSCIAAAAILYVARDVPRLSFANVEHAQSWSDALDNDKILDCYQLTEQVENDKRPFKRPKVVPQVRIMGSRARARPTGDLSSLTFSFYN
jgi:cyclin D1/2/4